MSPLVAYNLRPFAPATAATRTATVAARQAVADPAIMTTQKQPPGSSELAAQRGEKAVVAAGAGLAASTWAT